METRKRNAEATKQKILQAATSEFAGKGFDGARVDDIAELAQVNKQMIYHYFTSKDGLFTAVLESAYRHFRAKEAALKLDALPADQAILRIVEFTWKYYLKHPEFIKLLNSENQLEARHLKASPHTTEINAGHLPLMQELLQRGRRERTVRPDLDAMQVNINIASLGFFYLMNRHTLSMVFQSDLGSRAALNRRLAVMKDVIARWIRP